MAQRVREFRWAATPLGPVENWSAALKWAAGLVLASAFPMAVRWGPQLVLIYNDAYRTILADKHPGVLGKPLREVWWEIYQELGPLNEEILAGRRGAFFAEDLPWRVQRRGSEWEDANFTISYSPVPDATAPGGIGGVLTTVVETTERVRAENALRASEDALLDLNETLEAQVAQRTRERDRIWRVSEDLLGVSNFAGYFTGVNPAWTATLGWTEDEIRAMHVSELRHPDDAAEAEAGRARLLGGVPAVRMENRFRHKDGSWRWIYWTMTAEDGLIYIIGRHVTAEKEAAEALRRAEDQLRQAHKMEAIGQLTGGIAHDFNNLLTGILGSLEMIRIRIAQARQGEIGHYVDAATTAANRAAALTHRLLAFARRQPLDPKPLDIDKLVGSMADLLRRTIGEAITMELVPPAGLWFTFCDRNQLETALLNLVINARDAMPGGGMVRMATRNAPVDSILAPFLDLVPGEYVCLSVIDTGTGMTPEVIARAFDPFFTTKPLGQGTGLGLSMVYGFAKQSDGHVRIDSVPGHGTRVELYLPRYRGAVGEEGDPTGRGGGAEFRPHAMEAAGFHEVVNGNVLVVEDEAGVRDLVLDVLRELGCRTIEARDGPSALEILQSPERIDLVVTDVGLPGMNGRQLANAARELRPGLKILFITGYAEDAAVATGFLRPGMSMVTKPFAIEALAERIRDLIGSGRG